MARTRLVDRLADTIRSETKLLTELSATMQRQRRAVAIDDLEGIDESVFSTQRVLATLAEARRRRRWLSELLGEGGDLSLSALESFFGGNPPENVRAATAQLGEAARQLQSEVDLNRRVLQHAIDASNAHVRALCGIPAATSVGYPGGPHARDGASGGHILDRSI
jgi:hypothetical protein